jgi:hypothetical protein
MEYQRDLTRECIESNPGPVSVDTRDLYFASYNMFNELEDYSDIIEQETIEYIFDFSYPTFSDDDDCLEWECSSDAFDYEYLEEMQASETSSSDSSDSSEVSSDSSVGTSSTVDSGNTWCSHEDYSDEEDESLREWYQAQDVKFFILSQNSEIIERCNDYISLYFARRWYEHNDTEIDFILSELRRSETIIESLGGWVKDLTDEGIEPNPGPDMSAIVLTAEAYYGKQIDFVESLLIFTYNCHSAKNKNDIVVAILNYLKHTTTSGSLLTSDLSANLMERAQQIYDMCLQSDDGDDTPYIECLSDILQKYDMIKESTLYKKIYKFFMYILSLSIFGKFGLSLDNCNYTALEQEAIQRKYHLGPDFIHCMLDTIVFIYTRGVQSIKLGTVDPFFHDECLYGIWVNKCMELKAKSLYLSNPEILGFTLFDYLSDLREAIDTGKCIYKAIRPMDKNSRNFIARHLSECEMLLHNAMSRKDAQKSREAPFSVLVHGGSSVAKSTFTRLLFTYFAKLHKLPLGDEFIYTRNAADEFWVGFNTTQWCIIMDDIAYLNPNKCGEVDKTLKEIIQIINSTAFVPTQAALEDKGKTPMRCKLVIATTNTIHLNVNTYFSCPLAVQRRLPYVVSIKPKSEYTIDGCMIDGAKLPAIDDSEFPDYWTFQVFKVVPHELNEEGGIQYAKHKLIKETSDVNELLVWFGQTSKRFFEIQKKEMNCKSLMLDVEVCAECCYTKSRCVCEKLQAGEVGSYQHVCQTFITDYIIMFLLWFYTYTFKFGGFIFYYIVQYIISYSLNGRPRVSAYYGRLIGASQRSYLGGLSSDQVSQLKIVFSIIFFGSMAYSFFKSRKKDNCDVQGTTGSRPEKDEDEIPNVWYKDDFRVTDLDISRKTCSMKGLGEDKVISLLSENCVTIISRSKDHNRYLANRAFCVGGQYYLTNNHAVPDYTNHTLDVITNPNTEGVREQYVIPLTSKMIQRLPEKDLCLLWLPQVRPRKNHIDLFCQKTLKGIHKGYLLNRKDDGVIHKQPVFNAYHTCDKIIDLDISCESWVMQTNTPTVKGDCGSIVISFSNGGPIILGIHVGLRQDGKIRSLKVSQQDVEKLLSSYDVPIIQSGRINYSAPSSEQKLINVHTKSEVRFVDDGNALVYGSFEGHRSKPKSNVRPSPLAKTLTEYGYDITHGKPEMRGWEPWRNNLLQSLSKDLQIDIDILFNCADSFSEDLVKGLSPKDLSKLIEYDDFTTLNGAAGVRFVDKINRNTSAGFPFNKSKRHFLEAIPEQHGLPDPVEFTEDILERIAECEDCYDNNTQYHPIYMAALKDEPRSFEKIATKNTRVFTGGPVEHVFVTRKELLSYTKVMQENKFISECAAGTVAQSIEWDNIYRYLIHYGNDRIFDGDYKKFDKSMQSAVILAVFKTITNVLRKAGATQDHINRCWCIGYDLAFAVINFNGTLMQFMKGHVSGEALTVLVNSHANSLYLRYAYTLSHPHRHCRDFKKNINLITYGDDFVGGVHPECNFFNFKILQTKLKEINIEITPADKKAGAYTLMDISKIQFLKRSFRYSEELNLFVCPLEEESIKKSLLVNVASKTITDEAQSIACVESAIREYFWYGRKKFENQKEFLKHIVSLNPEVEYYVQPSTFPHWEQLIDDYWLISGKFGRYDVSAHLQKYL